MSTTVEICSLILPTLPIPAPANVQNIGVNGMHEEFVYLKAKGIYEEVDVVPPNRRPVQCKWVLHITVNAIKQA
jgi:hypothetical protein